jgi:uncharacterized protein YndB with AHSA1/START domain
MNDIKRMDITVSRTIGAAPDEVYDAWLDSSRPGGLWFGVARAIVHPEVDGLFYHSVAHEGREWAHYGRFVKLERGKRLEHTWMSEATRGLESVVTITLEPSPAGTEVTLRHTNLPDDEMGRGHEGGWGWYLSVLAERFAREAAQQR